MKESEAQLERQLIAQLQGLDYERVHLPDEQAVFNNFHTQLNRLNAEVLKGVPLNKSELDRLYLEIGRKSVFESAVILRDQHVFRRDTGEDVYLQFFDSHDASRNHFQVANQVEMIRQYKGIFDVTLLLNGLPIVQMELKRRGVDFKEAYNQVQRYRRQTYGGLFRFIQLFVVSNGTDTKYFANSDGDILFSHLFYWSDEKNHRITELSAFADSFFEHKRLTSILNRYMIIKSVSKELLVMRPYQIYAVEAIEACIETPRKNGYVWHTTGSGKTLTSFKASQLIKNHPDVDRVIFLVDRTDLDSQTVEEFNQFEKDSVDMVKNTGTLVKQLRDPTCKLIVTTIQKMDRAVKKNSAAMQRLRDQRIVFVIDECHRSQFGSMQRAVAKHFRNAQYFGFTGTPILEKNRSTHERTTADVFGECLHDYLIRHAIHDGNVLGFSVEYINTFKGKDGSKPAVYVQAINEAEVWNHEERLKNIAENILMHHEKKVTPAKYTAFFAVSSIENLVKYYDLLQNMNQAREPKDRLRIGGVFTYAANDDLDDKVEHPRESLERIITDFNSMFGTNHSTNEAALYKNDVSNRVKSADIDILLVVDMFLTGFDAKRLNTLYVDKGLQWHGLLQAFSRTNRVEKPLKQHGNIVCYRPLKEQVDASLRLFSKSDDANIGLMKTFEEYKEEYVEHVEKLREVAATPAALDELMDERDQQKFVQQFRSIVRTLRSMESFQAYNAEDFADTLSEVEYADYRSKYTNLHRTVKAETHKESILHDIDFEMEIVQVDKINVSYIMDLLLQLDLTNDRVQKKQLDDIRKELARTGDPKLQLKSDLIEKFLDSILPTLTEQDSVREEYLAFEMDELLKEKQAFAKDMNIPFDKLEDLYTERMYSGRLPNPQELRELVPADMGIGQRSTFRKKVGSFIERCVDRFF